MIQQAYKYVGLGLWPYLTFFQAENHLHIEIKCGWGLEKSELLWEQNVL